jgi:hypothetical protein
MVIKHLVVSGGYHLFAYILGSLHKLETDDIFNISNIETIWCVSSGSFVAICIALLKGYRNKITENTENILFSWDVIENYIEERPWSYLFINPSFCIYDILYKKGIYDEMIIHSIVEPLLKLLDLSLTITLEEFYEYTKVEIHFYSFDIYQFQMIDIYYKTYPNMTLVDAIYVTASVPFLSIPHIEYNKCFIDGGCIINYPICYALKRITQSEEILGYNTQITTLTINNKQDISIRNESVFYYIYFVLSTLYTKIYNIFICRTENSHTEAVYQDITNIDVDNNDSGYKYYNEINLEPLTNDKNSFYEGLIVLFQDLYEFLYSNEKRRVMMDNGKERINIIKKFFTYNN